MAVEVFANFFALGGGGPHVFFFAHFIGIEAPLIIMELPEQWVRCGAARGVGTRAATASGTTSSRLGPLVSTASQLLLIGQAEPVAASNTASSASRSGTTAIASPVVHATSRVSPVLPHPHRDRRRRQCHQSLAGSPSLPLLARPR